MTDANPDYAYKDILSRVTYHISRCEARRLLSHEHLATMLDYIEAECQQHNNPGVNIGAHALAGKILKILEGGK